MNGNLSYDRLVAMLGPDWAKLLENDPLVRPVLSKIASVVTKERQTYPVYPKPSDVFRAYRLTPPQNVKVVILGQDPYHTPGKADGLAFSSPEHPQLGSKPPPSLANIFVEIERDLALPMYRQQRSTDLSDWATQGVFLLNTVLTVREGLPASHAQIGWQTFTGATIKAVACMQRPVVFMLWGSKAHAYEQTIRGQGNQHLILSTTHPSPYSAHMGFNGCGHFSAARDFLLDCGQQPINW